MDSDPKNSWFMVASTYMDGSSAVIRTVGYNHHGRSACQNRWVYQYKTL